jgi:hypothetical protein
VPDNTTSLLTWGLAGGGNDVSIPNKLWWDLSHLLSVHWLNWLRAGILVGQVECGASTPVHKEQVKDVFWFSNANTFWTVAQIVLNHAYACVVNKKGNSGCWHSDTRGSNHVTKQSKVDIDWKEISYGNLKEKNKIKYSHASHF